MRSKYNRLNQVIIVAIVAIITFCCIQNSVLASVYVCKNDDCSSFVEITQKQLYITASTDEKPKVETALENSIDEAIRNGYSSKDNWDLGIAKFWHKGGSLPFDSTYDHLTVKAYKGPIYKKTCHIYSFTTDLVSQKYQTSCIKPSN